MAAARDYALSAAILGGQAGYRPAGGPWWAEFALAALELTLVDPTVVTGRTIGHLHVLDGSFRAFGS